MPLSTVPVQYKAKTLSEYAFRRDRRTPAFTPVDSYRFSGETSFKSLGEATDSFLQSDAYGNRRQSFRVLSENTPPQTTIMGAIRYLLLIDRGMTDQTPVKERAEVIGKRSFNLTKPQNQMGIIQRISAVCLTGYGQGQKVLCVPAPEDNQYDAADQGTYLPMTAENDYDPKKEPRKGYFAYSIHEEEEILRVNAENAIAWRASKAFFKKYDQAAFQIPKDNYRPGPDEGHYHLQERCRLRDAALEPKMPCPQSAYLKGPAFCAIVDMQEPLNHPEKRVFLSLGAKESIFQVSVQSCDIDLNKLKPPICANDMHRVALVSPARLPNYWREKYGLTRALLTTRTVRCASSDDNFRMSLEPQRYTYADTGSVFYFSDSVKRDAFAKELEESNLRTCGFNQSICY